MQSTILIILIVATYLVLLIQYKKATDRGAKGLLGTLISNASLHSLNNRTLLTMPLMLMAIMVCVLVSNKSMLRLSFASWQLFEIIFLSCLCCLVSVVSAFSGPIHSYPDITLKEKINYFSIRIPGLIIYEIFFRGILLGTALQLLSAPFSIALNVFLYTVAHVFSSRKEFVGSILFGFALCYIAILSRSVYPCVLIHLAIALPYEMIVLNKYNHTIKNIGL